MVSELVIDRLHDRDWTFPEADTQYATHGLHKYPARMPPQIPDQLLAILKKTNTVEDGGVLYDPFVGSGSTTTEAIMHGLHATGNDINPFACFLARAKGTTVSPERFKDLSEEFLQTVEKALNNPPEVKIDELGIREGWFPDPQLAKLVAIRGVLDDWKESVDKDLLRILRVSFSNIIRSISYQRNGEFKRYRMSEEDREDHDPDVMQNLKESVKEVRELLRELQEYADNDRNLQIYPRDSRQADHLPARYYDCVITSPPYGDHKTTVAYGEFSRDLALLAGDYELDEVRPVDNRGLGGTADPEGPPMDKLRTISPTLDETIKALVKRKEKRKQNDKSVSDRDKDALKFFQDYYAVLADTARRLKSGALSAWVVANRTMRRVPIPTNIITEEFGQEIGYEVHEVLKRDIPGRTLPSKNAPENVVDQKGDMMVKESIVLMSAP